LHLTSDGVEFIRADLREPGVARIATDFCMDVEEVPCNLCGSTESLPLYTLRDTGYGVPGEFVLRRCLHCGLMYLSPRPTQETIAAYYPEKYDPYRPAIEDERWAVMCWIRRRKLARKRHMIERYGEVQGCLLDIGCSTGLFLHEMAQAGWQVAGIEPIASAAEYARRRFGLRVFQGMFSEAHYEPASFDVVTFWDVLEHTFSPAEELAHAARLLRPGGLLVANVPNWDSPDRWLFGRHWLGLDPPRHLYAFTRGTLTAMLAQAGFSVLDWVCFMSGYFSFAVSLEQWLETVDLRLSRFAKRVFGLPGMRFPFEPWFTLNNWLGKGPNITVVARRM
jgi:SAM-dependent methyltransferase